MCNISTRGEILDDRPTAVVLALDAFGAEPVKLDPQGWRHPCYWAAFVASGADGAVGGLR